MTRLSSLQWSTIGAIPLAIGGVMAHSVNVGMQAAFPSGPYLLELLETAAGENSSAYFPLLDQISSGKFKNAASESELYNTFVEVLQSDGHVTSPDALSTFNLALSLRAAAPRIEAHYSYYETAIEEAGYDNGCDIWVLLDGKQYCTPERDTVVAEGSVASLHKSLPFDRTFGTGTEAVLYADPTLPEFGAFHNSLRKEARDGFLTYHLRYRRPNKAVNEPLPVGGYGVELALKRTDYIVIDDREAEQSNSAQKPLDKKVGLETEEEISDIRPLSTSELSQVGVKAASFIMQSENPMDTFTKLVQDFPRYSASLAQHEVSKEFVRELEEGRAEVPGGINFLWMNGAQLIERQIEPFALVEMLRRERKLIQGVRDLGLTGKQAVALLGHSKVAQSKGGEQEAIRYDWTDRQEDGRVLIWLNDLESDERYEDYPKEIGSLLQRAYPGQIPPIAKNIFNIIVPVDFANEDDLSLVVQILNIINRGIPVRFGLVPIGESDASEHRAKLTYHTVESYGVSCFAGFIGRLVESPSAGNDEAYTKAIAQCELQEGSTALKYDEVLNEKSYTAQLDLARHWSSRLKAQASPSPMFVNGVLVPRSAEWMQGISMQIGEDLQTVQRAAYHGTIDDETWFAGIFLENALSKRNSYLSGEAETNLKVLDVNKLYKEHNALFETVPVIDATKETSSEHWAVVTAIVDVLTEQGLGLLMSALEFKRNNPGIRLDVIANPSDISKAPALYSRLKAAEQSLSKIEDLQALQKATNDESVAVTGNDVPTALGEFLSYANIASGANAVLLNGRVLGPILGHSSFTADDFQALFETEQKKRIVPVYEALEDLGLSDKLSNPLSAARITSITALSTISDLPEGIFESAPDVRTALYENWNSTHTAIEVGNPDESSIHIVGLLNPVSDQGQRWGPILKVLSELDGVYLKLFLNPKSNLKELPVKRFFRYVLDAKPSFDADGKTKAPKAIFKSLPSEALLTAGMDVPPAWLVAPKKSVYDLDNIKLSSSKSDIDATYELEHILIQGHSRDAKRSPPSGAQLVLGTEKNPHVTDTIIMSNLGFFQFKANPGYYNIRLKKGRSDEIFEIESVGALGYNRTPGDEGTDLALMDFQGSTVYPRMKRKPGMEMEEVLKNENDGDNVVSKGLKFAEGIYNGLTGSKSASAKDHADINIFSVASGHLYERMLNIMMVSVMKHTKQTVKFWFIEQFLSPSFKQFIPHLAEEYGFKYEMVTYKWPHWLRQQKEKQREIWGYKILFLDVLFPLSLDKVIFVDADQIVRTDMMDLVNLDLEGAPYGFTPMCDSRTEMEGFRFWKQGYWERYLRGRPYHISALYVVDLQRFRELAAGDRLRQQYHALSADPGSLSNLDQDLPNHMQFQIPIHSLPQEWLWCETWCSDESLTNARTIDLCNNPETKEPKLDRARRQVPEWTEYDDEIAALSTKVRKLQDGASEQEANEGKQEDVKEKANVNTKSRTLEEEVHTKDEL